MKPQHKDWKNSKLWRHLTDPHLSQKLLADARGELPITVFEEFVMSSVFAIAAETGIRLNLQPLDMLASIKPKLDPDDARRRAKMLLYVQAPCPERDGAISRLLDATCRKKRGRPPKKRILAIRVWVLHKFTSATWREIAVALAPDNASRDMIERTIPRLKKLRRDLNRLIKRKTQPAPDE